MSETVSLDELESQIAELQRKREQIIKEQRAQIVKELREKAKKFAIEPGEIFSELASRPERKTSAQKLTGKLVEARDAFDRGVKVWRNGDKIYIDAARGIRPAWLSQETLVSTADQLK